MANGITKITVQGFKSLYDETSIEIRPLTILAGANSSGKSSIMQPLLLMKQTLEANYDPGTFLLDGPNVKFTRHEQMFSYGRVLYSDYPESSVLPTRKLTISIETEGKQHLSVRYKDAGPTSIDIDELLYAGEDNKFGAVQTRLHNTMSATEVSQITGRGDALRESLESLTQMGKINWRLIRDRCFLSLGLFFENGEAAMQGDLSFYFLPLSYFSNTLRNIVHLPGMRKSPTRNYQVADVNNRNYEGTFDNYFASVLNRWETADFGKDFSPAFRGRADEAKEKLNILNQQLGRLKINRFVKTRRIDNTQFEIMIQRSEKSDDSVSIADVGLGVSQVLPVLVALLVAEPEQMVYIEQPELHLHPRAQVALAEILAEAANRGVRVVIETHSSLLIQGIQTLIAQKKLPHEKVILHWFTRDEEGKTHVDPHVPDELGTTGDWPEDFSIVQMEADSDYLTAVEKRELEQFHARQKPEVPGD